MSNHSDVLVKINEIVLIELIHAAKNGNPLFKQLGIDQSTMNDLSCMNLSELRALSEVPFINLGSVNTRTLNLSVQKTINRRNHESLLKTAIKLGASRDVMKAYANMSSKDFNQLRTTLDLGEMRNRPSILSDVEYANLAEEHNQFGADNKFITKLDHLRCLIYLSEKLSIDINRIYRYFYIENQELFLTEQYKG